MPVRQSRRRGPEVYVLKLGHRPGRDPRLTTHLALAARALGARALYLNPMDEEIAARLESVNRRFGGDFQVIPAPEWRKVVAAYGDSTVHLTMYGEPLARRLPQLRRRGRILLVVGGSKVPAAMYQLARFNVCVGSQPHSEVAAVSVVLDRLLAPVPATRFRGGTHRIVPQSRGKRVAQR